jgi:hypothetical protein
VYYVEKKKKCWLLTKQSKAVLRIESVDFWVAERGGKPCILTRVMKILVHVSSQKGLEVLIHQSLDEHLDSFYGLLVSFLTNHHLATCVASPHFDLELL